jgi:hypothetical protein
MSSITPLSYPYITSKGEGGKYPNKVLKGIVPVEVNISLLEECLI